MTPNDDEYTVFAPGVFDKFVGVDIPVKNKPGGVVIGKANISRDGEVINVELDSGQFPQELIDGILTGFVDALSIAPSPVPEAVPVINKKDKS